MPLVATPTPPASRSFSTRKVSIKASRPALIDLRFKGDAWLVVRDTLAAVCLGDTALGHVAISPFDLPTLNRTLLQVRMGQARRNYTKRIRRLRVD